ncbi:ML domain-containing protein [Gorgonomyces haynaldii]|nr:ML domain-containing protein [Gorgonomyces haynaldii]
MILWKLETDLMMQALCAFWMFLPGLSLFVGARQIPLFTDTADGLESSTIVFCGAPSDVFIPKDVVLVPDPPVKGSPLAVRLTGYLKEDIIEGSRAHVKAKLGFVTLLDKDYDVCSEVHQIDKECPIKQGDFILEKTFDIPQEAPGGRYRVHLESFTHDEKPIACVDADFRFSW